MDRYLIASASSTGPNSTTYAAARTFPLEQTARSYACVRHVSIRGAAAGHRVVDSGDRSRVLGFGNLVEPIEDQQDAIAADEAAAGVGSEHRGIRNCRVLLGEPPRGPGLQVLCLGVPTGQGQENRHRIAEDNGLAVRQSFEQLHDVVKVAVAWRPGHPTPATQCRHDGFRSGRHRPRGGRPR